MRSPIARTMAPIPTPRERLSSGPKIVQTRQQERPQNAETEPTVSAVADEAPARITAESQIGFETAEWTMGGPS